MPFPDTVASAAIVTALLAAAPLTCKFPWLMVVAPVNEFMPLKICVPAPTFVNAPAPLMLPEKFAVPVLPAVKVVPKTTLPAPASEATVSL